MDYPNRMNRLSILYEKKQKLELISHTQLQTHRQNLHPNHPEIPQSSDMNLFREMDSKALSSMSTPAVSIPPFDQEAWRKEIHEKKARAEMKGFQSVFQSKW